MNHLIGIKELADHLGISVKTLRVRVSKGKIAQPVKREGNELFWPRPTSESIRNARKEFAKSLEKPMVGRPINPDQSGIHDDADDLTYALPASNPGQFGDPDLLLGRSKPHPADLEIGIQHEGGQRRGEMTIVQAKSRKDKSEYLYGTDPDTLLLDPSRSLPFDEDVKHAYLRPIQPLIVDDADNLPRLGLDELVATGMVSDRQATMIKARGLSGEFNVDVLKQPPQSYADGLFKKDSE